MARLGNRLSRSVAPLIDEHLESRARPVEGFSQRR
jgi:hypothetical protein